MKVPASVRELHAAQEERNSLLKEAVENLLKPRLQNLWHYESRMKSEESFALKIESGRFPEPGRLEDFFACTIVVRNFLEIKMAEAIARDLFAIHERRPQSSVATTKDPDCFRFDDLRLYVRYKKDKAVREKGFEDIVFEIQIKTFLQHAWALATHDLVYKADSVNWPKARVAFQVKAMLEHAEVSIAGVDGLANCQSLPRENPESKMLSEIILMLREFWADDQLPKDLVRLAKNIAELTASMDLKIDDLKSIIQQETAAGGGARLQNLSPYLAIIKAISVRSPEKIRAIPTKQNPSFRMLVPPELDFPRELLDALTPKRVVSTST